MMQLYKSVPKSYEIPFGFETDVPTWNWASVFKHQIFCASKQLN